MESREMSHTERSLLAIALIFIIVIAAKMTAYIVSLVLMALIMTMLATPALSWLKKKGLSDFPATLVIAVVACLIMLGVIGLTALSVNTVISDLNRDKRVYEPCGRPHVPVLRGSAGFLHAP